MPKLKLYIACSLNGKIARADGSVDWLEEIPNPDKLDFGYEEFYDSVDTTIQGYSTYAQIISWGIPFPYAGKKNYVITRNPDRADTEYVEFISEDPVGFVRGLKAGEGSALETAKDIWLIGGGQVNTLFLNAGLIDELILFIMPVVLPDGIDLFSGGPYGIDLPGNATAISPMQLLKSRNWSNGVMELRYKSGYM